MKRLLLCLLFAALTLAGVELRIVCTADLHGALSRFVALATPIRAAGPDALRLDAGDLASGDFYAEYSGGLSIIGALNRLNYDVLVPGNHDFELGFEAFRTLLAGFKGTVLGADWEWNGLRTPAWKLFRRNGISVAVIGLTDPKMPRRMLPGSGAHFRDPFAALEGVIREIRSVRPEVVVLVWHNGLYGRPAVSQILRRFPEIDLVFCGHTHRELPGQRSGRAWVVQAGCMAQAAAVVSVEVDDRTRRIRRIVSRLVRPDFRCPDPEIRRWAGFCRASLEAMAHAPLSGFPREFRRPHSGEFNAAFGVFAVEKLRRRAGTEAGVLMLPIGESAAGTPCRLGLHHIMPYRNILCVAELTRSELFEVVRWCFNTGKKFRQVPFFRGFTVRRSPRGALIGIDAPEKLTVALNDYILLSVPALRHMLKSKPCRWRSTGIVEREALLP